MEFSGVRIGFCLLAVTVSVTALGSAALAFACLLASIAFFRFSGSPLFLAALLRALVNDFAERGVRMVKPYFFLYSFGLMPWETRCLEVSWRISAPHWRQITLSFWIEFSGVSFVAANSSAAVGANSISPASAFCISHSVP